MSEQQKAPSFEQALEELESLVNELEHGELPLEKSLEKFEKAIQLARTSQQQLQQAEQKVTTLMAAQEGSADNDDGEVM
ncbi:exodeoxyribonuclease VII small subunit [Idiomarina sp. WRN-38]|jgi:exodeoxyribonuclease VII small subunit|uniref:Exodeoxyribonuclease 7 small subunit n=1 Tax=Idiomarina piscisalsi TaxID=1096243 RepID=A0A432YRA0_9GAMM|nr:MULTISPECIES: exodeoxyribonuclease VII small subunit [Idiomarina]KTG29818.1 exodeoxyribonuclease VII small subunit [Idiomarina sp. H105]MBF37762.1 exodeoxyribonuclease VII small subunit [Idiomarinaceae bacterium]OAF13209.1 exodeoxyribonuclease VII small subunit [Idiomarina sp. WRN-38]RUO64231.1 exodeoxyribonuclease VII small subunit [Idiomarina piscisalsi]WPZ00885.1 exodeoxyribonuclease VII small subunit [Idiomarina sp. OXR-189]|tara:strand:- start:33 stop:269 length:237 start_codon:yes stop_codon:yes gene_type:complete